MRNYTPENYAELVESIADETLRGYMRAEQEFIEKIEGASSQTFIDLGAGYGRVLPTLSRIARSVIAIELNPEMFQELQRRSLSYGNVTAILGDFLHLSQILPEHIARPVFLFLQNTLGTIERGSPTEALDVVTGICKEREGGLILSLFRQPALLPWGVTMYQKLQKMVGNVEMGKSDFTTGVLVTDTGYRSKWWTDNEIETFRQLGKVVRESTADAWELLQIDFPRR